MAEEHHQTTIQTIFDLEQYNHDEGEALFKQRLPKGGRGRFHYWSMELSDWEAMGRPTSFLMILSPHVEINVEIDLDAEQRSSVIR